MSEALAAAIDRLNETVTQVRSVVEGMPEVMKGAVDEALGELTEAQKAQRAKDIQNADVEDDGQAFKRAPQTLSEIRRRPARTDEHRELQRLSDQAYTQGFLLRASRCLRQQRAPHEVALQPDEIPAYRELHGLAIETRAINDTNLSELFPTEYSYTMIQDVRTEMKVAGLFQQINLPRSPFTWPVRQPLSGRSYIVTPTSVDTPSTIKTRDADAYSVTFDATVFAVRTVWDKQFDEDAIVDLEAYTRDLIVRQLTEDLDDAIINGDDSASHFDSAVTASDDPRRLFKGLRKFATSPTTDTVYDCAETSKGTAAYEAGDIKRTRKMMGKYGLSPQEAALIQSISAYYDATDFTEVKTLEVFGQQATILTGQLASVWGIPVVVSEKVPETLDDDGLDTGAGTTTAHILVNRRAYALAMQRGLTLETDYTPRTQQLEIIGSMRADFQPWEDPTTATAVAVGKKIPL